jgi:hypothetical protein
MSAPVTEWVEEARRMLAAGATVNDICRALNRSRTNVRNRLNINGSGDKDAARRAAYAAELAAARCLIPTRVFPRKAAAEPVEVISEPVKVSLPFVGILAGHVSPSYQMVRL